MVEGRNELRLEEIRTYNFKWIISIDRLIQLVSGHHYSTFESHTPEELKTATARFEERLKSIFDDRDNISHDSGYTLLTVRKR